MIFISTSALCIEFIEYEVKPTLFTYNELRTASNDFHQSMELGEGGYGIVYKVNKINFKLLLECMFY